MMHGDRGGGSRRWPAIERLNRKDPKDAKRATASSIGVRSTATRRDKPAPSLEAGSWKPFFIFASFGSLRFKNPMSLRFKILAAESR